ncbi:MAG: HupE/UreJ family protein [Flavobacteriia bacterium]|nr:HupE/UreJ family protein [Flavobacteriia bacterium]OIP47858.1 MAG: HupE / UreJ protein [Flavobacteriaceae bacterium CG2_30_31_66]PIV97223.1 MAG: HupE / UreJ protein [Flavobacteriaceae bacterium CG17_big_fil_post_rev_8_21_14_2_50_31_13]PIX15174.1 MAG: HupE / UreJ protein [Flavobacteriaceae bacterium CG_4_8_14_3_um_filter_31_8]PIY15897.1 MAG: HupE / UreJ protein [Flavobacteriaceae bacterium CG_4_10_14_3_um_filter_31_253]PIZ12292.1 MAG: HupE / UreJ protein [Flavobacteriaceae bacterium CG_4_10_
MDDFLLYLKMGLYHVLDLKAYDHVLFLIVLSVVFSFQQWKKILWLVTLFTIGHSVSLALSAYEIVKIKIELIEFLIPVTIFITGVTNIFNAKKISKTKDNVNLIFALFFGLIHGLGFSNYFRGMIGREEDKFLPLIEFALGIELAQVIIVLGILLLGVMLESVAKVSKRDWIMVTSSIVVGFSVQMMLDRVFW